MAIEKQRGCGFRTVGSLYLVGKGLAVSCDRLPFKIPLCATCGYRVHFTRGIAKINPYDFFGEHLDCQDDFRCPICKPNVEIGFLQWVGSDYTTESFVLEAQKLGVSKKISRNLIPKDFEIGKHWVYLAKQNILDDIEAIDKVKGKPKKTDAVFYAFKPQRIEIIITVSQSQDKDFMEKLREQKLTPVIVPDDDLDHNPKGKHKLTKKAKSRKIEPVMNEKVLPLKDFFPIEEG